MCSPNQSFPPKTLVKAPEITGSAVFRFDNHQKLFVMVVFLPEHALSMSRSLVFWFLIVFVGRQFGIFPSHEVFMLANVPVHNIAEELNITRDQVYAKYTKQTLAKNS